MNQKQIMIDIIESIIEQQEHSQLSTQTIDQLKQDKEWLKNTVVN